MNDTIYQESTDEMVLRVEAMCPMLPQLNASGCADLFFDCKAAEDTLNGLLKRVKSVRDAAEMAIVNKSEAEQCDSFKFPRGTISVKETNLLSIDPDYWDEIPTNFKQKRLNTKLVEECIEQGDERVADWLARGVLRVQPVKEVTFRRSSKE